MKEVYEKLVENLASMTPEEKEKEWEELKKYNNIGPFVEEILKKNNMEREIGEEFEVKLRLKVVESDRACKGCIFNDYEICIQMEQLGACDFETRIDGKNVHFKFISMEELKEN